MPGRELPRTKVEVATTSKLASDHLSGFAAADSLDRFAFERLSDLTSVWTVLSVLDMVQF